MRKDPVWNEKTVDSYYYLTGLQTCKEQLLEFERVTAIQIIRYNTQNGKHLYGVVVWHTDGTYRDISTSVGGALGLEFSWTIDKLRTWCEPLRLARLLCERMALPRERQSESERDWRLQPTNDTLDALWSKVRIFDAYGSD